MEGKNSLTIAIAADHRGYAIKTQLLALLKDAGCPVVDLGTHSAERCDSQDYAVAMAEALKDGRAHSGVLVCGSGNGIAIAANRFHHVRAAIAHNSTTARMAREHNDANVLVFGADMVGIEVMREALLAWMQARFQGGRYAERIERLKELIPLSQRLAK